MSNLAMLFEPCLGFTLRGLQTLEVIVGFHERVHRRRRCQCAIWPPLCVFLLTFWPECRAHRVNCEVPNTHLVHTMQVHAPLHEEVLAPSLIPVSFSCPFQFKAFVQSS